MCIRDSHTGIVCHVFENGDILIVEQNTPLSGVGGGHIDTWNYRVVNKQSQSDMGFVYALSLIHISTLTKRSDCLS